MSPAGLLTQPSWWQLCPGFALESLLLFRPGAYIDHISCMAPKRINLPPTEQPLAIILPLGCPSRKPHDIWGWGWCDDMFT